MAININGSGTITGVSVGGLPDGIVDTDMLATSAVSSAKLAAGAGGKVLQVVQTVKTSTTSYGTPGTYAAISGLSAAITPSATSSKVLILVHANVGVSHTSGRIHMRLSGTTSTSVGDANTGYESTATVMTNDNGHCQIPAIISFLDSPASASEVTYGVEWVSPIGTLYLNRQSNALDTYQGNTISTITLMEVAG